MSLSRCCLAAYLWALCAAAATSAPPTQSQPKTLTPQAAAFLQAISTDDAAAVAQKLKANPALANLPPSFYTGRSGITSDPPLSAAASRGDIQVITLLLKAGARVNAENEDGETPLEQAAQFGGKKEVALLLAYGANVAHGTKDGITALNRAIQADNAEAVALLLAHGANANARDRAGRTPLARALDPYHQGEEHHAVILKLLRQHGARE